MASRVHAPNTSLSNLSTCQQHMFCKKPLVGARGKRHSCQTREEMLFSPLCSGFSIAGAQSLGPTPTPQHHHPFPLAHIHPLSALQKFELGTLEGLYCEGGGRPGGRGSLFFRGYEIVKVYCGRSLSGLF